MFSGKAPRQITFHIWGPKRGNLCGSINPDFSVCYEWGQELLTTGLPYLCPVCSMVAASELPVEIDLRVENTATLSQNARR